MCGIAGALWAPHTPLLSIEQDVRRMAATLIHRGPDDAGLWSDPEARVCLGFRRLAIMDLSNAGHQPMLSHSQRSIKVMNG